ncbi:MAG: YrrC family ATP-dependent DNA helicase [Nostoc sp.]
MSTTPLPSQQQVNATLKHESITGVVERLTYYSQESGYTVARLQRPGAKELTRACHQLGKLE